MENEATFIGLNKWHDKLYERLGWMVLSNKYGYKKNIEAYYPPDWKYEKIACEDCYKQNIN